MPDDFKKDREEKMNKLKEQMESLDYLGILVDRVKKNKEKLSFIPRNEQTSQEKLWLLAYSTIEKKLSIGTAAGMVEFSKWLPILDETIT